MAPQVWTFELQKSKSAYMKKMVCGLPQINDPSEICEEWCKVKQERSHSNMIFL